MSNVEIAPTVKNLINEMRQLCEEDQRSLANAVLGERTLEAFVEELEDQLSCERSVTEDGRDQFT